MAAKKRTPKRAPKRKEHKKPKGSNKMPWPKM